jgi:predicted RNA-binding protein with PUA domain
MTPREVRTALWSAEAYCKLCRRSRTLRLGTLPARYQDTNLAAIPFRCADCGERAEKVHVNKPCSGRLETVWSADVVEA